VGFQNTLHVLAAESCLLVNLMPTRVVHDVAHRGAVLSLNDLYDLVRALGHFDVDRLFVASDGHDGATRERKKKGGQARMILIPI